MNENFRLKESNLPRKLFPEVPKTVKSKKEDRKPPEQKKKKSWLAAVIILCILFLISFCIYLFIAKDPKSLFLAAINQEYNNLVASKESLFSNSLYEEAKNTTLTTKGNITLEILQDGETIPDFQDLDLSYQLGRDYQKKQITSNFHLSYDQETIFDINTFGKPKSLYLELTELFSKYIKIDVEEYEKLFEDGKATEEDIEYLIQSTKNYLLEALEKKDFKTTSEKINFDGKEINAKKISYYFTAETTEKVRNYIIDSILKDEKYMTLLEKYQGKEKEDIKQSLTKMKEETLTFEEETVFSVYFDGFFNTPIRFEVIDPTLEITYNIYENKKEILFNAEDLEMNIEFNASQNTYEFKNSENTITITEKKDSKNHNFLYQIDSNGQSYNGAFDIKKEDEYRGSVTFTFNTKENMSLKISGTYENTIGEKVTLPENLDENNIDYQDMTDVDYEEIATNLLKNPFFASLFGGTTPTIS